jgi:chromosome segregation ATPase
MRTKFGKALLELSKEPTKGADEDQKQLKSASPKHAFTEAELRALGVAKGRLSLDSYVKAAGPGDKVFYFKPAFVVLQLRERFRQAVSHVFHKTVFVQTGAAKPREHDVDRVTLAGDKAIRKGSMSSGWLEARKSRRGAQADHAKLRGRLKALDANLTQLERDKGQHEARALETRGELDKHTVAHNKRLREADLEDELEAIDTGTTGGGGTDHELDKHTVAHNKRLAADLEDELEAIDTGTTGGGGTGRGGAESSSSGITGGVIGTSRDARKAVNKQKKSANKALQAAIESDQEQLRAVQQALKANFEPDGKLMDAERRELTEKQERLREKRRERDAAAPAAARAHASVSSLRASLSEDLRKRQDEFKEALERTIDANAAGGEWQPGGAAAEELCVAKERLAAAAEVLHASRKIADKQRARAQERLDEMCFKAADAAKGRADTAKQVDMLLQKKVRQRGYPGHKLRLRSDG